MAQQEPSLADFLTSIQKSLDDLKERVEKLEAGTSSKSTN